LLACWPGLGEDMSNVGELIKGYGPDFPLLEELLGIEASEADLLRLEQPIPELGRYLKDVKFMTEITSGRAIGSLRFQVITEYFIQLSEELSKRIVRNDNIVGRLSEDDKNIIRSLGTTPSEIIQAERIESFAEHDTAAATDLIKILIAARLPHLEEMIEGVHFACTSEDVMGNVFGIMNNRLVYGHVLPEIIDFCLSAMKYVDKFEGEKPMLLPGFTHNQAAEPTTIGKKFMTKISSIEYLMSRMMENGNFIPFTGKLGGAIGNLTTHYAAYPYVNWDEFAKCFVQRFKLKYEPLTDQSVTFAVEAQHYTTIANMLTEVMKFTEDFIDMASCPGQLFVKSKKKGAKGSSIMPNKSNAWGMEGALKMLSKSRDELFNYAKELPDYPHEGNMGRSYLMREIGNVFMPLFIGLHRISSELHKYHPNQAKIDAFFSEYPGMSGSVLQTVLKRMRVPGDAYRSIQEISINPDGSYANAEQFRAGLSAKMEELGLTADMKMELITLADPKNAIGLAYTSSHKAMDIVRVTFNFYSNLMKDMVSESS